MTRRKNYRFQDLIRLYSGWRLPTQQCPSKTTLLYLPTELIMMSQLTTTIILKQNQAHLLFTNKSISTIIIKNIATGKTSQDITPLHFFDYFELYN